MLSLGIDASATCTGFVVLESAATNHGRPIVRHEEPFSSKLKGLDRCSEIAERMIGLIEKWSPDRIVIEGYGGSHTGSIITVVEVGTVLRYFLRQMGRTWLEPAPTQVKKFVMGKQGPKSMIMMHVLKRWGHEAMNDDTADAYVLAAIGLLHGGKLAELTHAMLEVVGTLKPK